VREVRWSGEGAMGVQSAARSGLEASVRTLSGNDESERGEERRRGSGVCRCERRKAGGAQATSLSSYSSHRQIQRAARQASRVLGFPSLFSRRKAEKTLLNCFALLRTALLLLRSASTAWCFVLLYCCVAPPVLLGHPGMSSTSPRSVVLAWDNRKRRAQSSVYRKANSVHLRRGR
jgi:hypothetical protein